MDETRRKEQERRSSRGQGSALPPNFEQIDPHRQDQHRTAPHDPDRDDLNLEGAKRYGDPIPEDGETAEPELTPQPPNPGVSAAGGFAERTDDVNREIRPQEPGKK